MFNFVIDSTLAAVARSGTFIALSVQTTHLIA